MKMRSLIAVFGLTSLAGCLSVLPEPDSADALYRIEASSSVPLAYDVTIEQPEAPSILAGRALSVEDESGAVRLIRGAEWAGPATRQIQLALIDSFEVGEAGAATLPETGIIAPYEAAIRLTHFGLVVNEARCEATVTVVDATNRSVIARETVSTRESIIDLSKSERGPIMKSVAEACVLKMADFVGAALSD